MFCIFLSMRLFSYGEWIGCFIFGNLQACRYQISPSVETGCFPYSCIIFDKKTPCNKHVSLLWYACCKNFFIFLFNGNPEPDILRTDLDESFVDNLIVSIVLFLDIFFGLYFCIHFQIETWLLLKACKKDNAFAAFLKDNRESTNTNHIQCTLKVFFFF